jgi:GMP synthase (glutamine-hydrolysing)
MHVVVIDPAMRVAEVECFNYLALTTPAKLTYHLPAMYGMQSLRAERLADVAAVVIFGSASSVHDRLPWQGELEAWLEPVMLSRRVPTLGLCYGHQMLAHMLGGRVDYLYPERRKLSGFRDVTIDASPLGPARRGELVVSHNEAVVAAPPSMTVWAKSDAVAIDGLRHRELPIYSFQPHPEAVPEFLANHAIEPGPAPLAPRLAFGHELVAAFLSQALAQAGSSAT